MSSMFSVESGAYTAPVVTYDDLKSCLPVDPENAYTEPSSHIVTIKTCNSPDLLARCVTSLHDEVSLEYVKPIVIDDSKDADSREKNMRVAWETEAEYCAVGGKNSLVNSFGEYIAKTESETTANTLQDYLHRIVTDHPAGPSAATWGGVGGTQNLGHLRSVMQFGAQETPKEEWLSTFIDDDVLMPKNAQEVFRMIGLYHTIGSLSVIASSYLHHSGNPIILASNAFKELAVRADDMDQPAIGTEINNIINRTPTMGLRGERSSDARYSSPEYTLIFPGGNYSLTGGEAFDVPVPVVGIEDLGYAAMLQLFKGARELGVARVPDFIHKRSARQNGGDVHGNLSEFCRAEKDVDYNTFQKIAKEYAADNGASSENIAAFTALETDRNQSQSRRQRKLIQHLGELSRDERFASFRDTLSGLKQNIYEFALAKTKNANTLTLDKPFVEKLLKDMLTLHPQLVSKAYQFGQDGGLASYDQATHRS